MAIEPAAPTMVARPVRNEMQYSVPVLAAALMPSP
jgi:hypothetical protein